MENQEDKERFKDIHHEKEDNIIYEEVEEMEESFHVPKPDSKTKEIFEMAYNQHPIPELEDEEGEVSFVFTNLDTGETNTISSKETADFDCKHSFKRKQLKVSDDGAWYNFWKMVYKNNEELRAACERGDFDFVKNIVLQKESDYPIEVNSKGFDEWTALHFAAYEDHVNILDFLLEHSADVNAETRFGKTALHIASIRGNIESIIVLSKSGINLNHQDEEGNTALHIATQNGYEDIVEYLVKEGCSVLKNKINLSPLDIPGHPKIKLIFERYSIKQSQQEPHVISNELSPSKHRNTLKKLEENRIYRTPLEAASLTTDSFTYFKLLGKGSFGEVFLVRKTGDDTLYAMKVLSKEKIFGKNLIRYALTERNVLSAMNHPFIVKLHYTFQNDTKLFLVMEYCPGGDLGKMLAKKKTLTEDEARMYLSELILAFEALHKNMIVFRDLKPDNVVLDGEGHVKLTDFGLSKQGVYNNSTQSFCGSVAYLAPEILTKQGHSRTVDWYLLGLLTYELMVGIPPYYNSKKEVLFENIKRGSLKIPKSMSEPAKDLIKRLLSRDPSKRLGSQRDASQLREHPFFQGVDWFEVMNRKLPVPKLELPKVNLNDTIKVSFDQKGESKGKRIEQWTFINNL